MDTSTAGELVQELDHLPPDEEVPADLLLQALPSRFELSYVESALTQWSEIAEMYGRDAHPEVDAFLRAVRDVL